MAGVERWCVVTGGRGFAARHLVDMLIRSEMFCVRISDLGPSIKLDAYEEEGTLGKALRSGRAEYASADLRNKSQVLKAFQGAEVVFHMAAPDSSINNYKLQYSVNVEGTKNVIDVCVELQVKRLIYTSSPSVVFDGVHGIINGDETLPYPPKHNDFYSATKAEGEALVIKANGVKGLRTCCIRPSSIFGPGDKLLVPSLVSAARAGKSKFIIGDGRNMYDFTYVENVAHAHICAERALASEGASDEASGQAYFVTNMEPIKFWEFMSLILEGLCYERPGIKIPAELMMPIAHLVECTYKLLGPYGMKVPQLTPSRVRLLSCSRTFNASKAKDRLGYTPIVSLQEGLQRTIESYSHLRAEPRSKRDGKGCNYMASGERWCVVTGGRGFAARHLVDMLIQYEMFCVRITDLGPSIKLDPQEEGGTIGKALRNGRAQYISVDLRNKSQVLKACQGAEVVFHMAAPDSSFNNYQLQHSVNVEGTKNLIDACIELQVKRLIYTSSPSVVFDGVHGIINGDETLPYSTKHNDFYSATKAQGEALVIKANGIKGFRTCSIRPSSIFGPGDKLLVPCLVDVAKTWKGKFIIGDGTNLNDFTYVENVAHAHICAERALAAKGAAEEASGQAYFVTNMEPIEFWEFMSLILEGLGYERPRIKIPACVMMPFAHLVAWTYKLLAPYGMEVPQLTPSRIRLLSCNRTFNASKAKDRLGYTPIVSLQEGIERTIESYSHLRAEHRSEREGPSKAYLCLGSGRVADTLLWKDKKQSLITVLILAAFYYNFIAYGYTIIAAVSKLIFAGSIFLYIHAHLPKRIFGYTIEKVPVSAFHCSREGSQRIARAAALSWNSSVGILKSLCRGDDWMLFVKVVAFLLIMSLLGALSLRSLFLAGLPFMFVAFFIYEKKEEDIDRLVSRAISYGCKLKSDLKKKVLRSS